MRSPYRLPVRRLRGAAMTKLSRRQIIYKNATKDDLHSFGGQVSFAAHPGSRGNRQQYYSERCATTTDKFLTLDDVAELIRQLRDGDEAPAILTQLCSDAGGIFVPVEDVSGSTGLVAEGLARIATEFGEVASAMGSALADRVVDGAEAHQCQIELDDLIREALSLKTRLAAIVDEEDQ